VDISDVAVEKSRRRTEENRREDKNHYLCSDVFNYVPTGQFDVILFRDSIYYVPHGKIIAMLRRYSKYLKEGGVFIVRMWNLGREREFKKCRLPCRHTGCLDLSGAAAQSWRITGLMCRALAVSPADGKATFVLLDRAVSHSDSLAKHAVARREKLRSWVTGWADSRTNRTLSFFFLNSSVY
jgi:SAM-dependent methyltransferase